MLLAEELRGGITRITWINVQTGRVLGQQDIDATIISCAQADGGLYAYATDDAIHVRVLSDGVPADTRAGQPSGC
jgi:hypothetical protein